MKYKLFVVGESNGSGMAMKIAASDEFVNLETLIKQLDLFGTEWEVTEYGETVLSADAAAK